MPSSQLIASYSIAFGDVDVYNKLLPGVVG